MIHPYEGRLSINVHGPITKIEIVDQKSGVFAFELDMSSEDLLAAIARHGNVTCRFWINDLGTVGSTREVKSEMVPFDFMKHKHPADEYRTLAAVKALAPFEVDGWSANERDLWNGHNVEQREDEGRFQKVTFVRFLRNGVPIVNA